MATEAQLAEIIAAGESDRVEFNESLSGKRQGGHPTGDLRVRERSAPERKKQERWSSESGTTDRLPASRSPIAC